MNLRCSSSRFLSGLLLGMMIIVSFHSQVALAQDASRTAASAMGRIIPHPGMNQALIEGLARIGESRQVFSQEPGGQQKEALSRIDEEVRFLRDSAVSVEEARKRTIQKIQDSSQQQVEELDDFVRSLSAAELNALVMSVRDQKAYSSYLDKIDTSFTLEEKTRWMLSAVKAEFKNLQHEEIARMKTASKEEMIESLQSGRELVLTKSHNNWIWAIVALAVVGLIVFAVVHSASYGRKCITNQVVDSWWDTDCYWDDWHWGYVCYDVYCREYLRTDHCKGTESYRIVCD